MKKAIVLLTVAMMTLIMTVSMFGTSETTSSQLERETRWEQTHQVIKPVAYQKGKWEFNNPYLGVL